MLRALTENLNRTRQDFSITSKTPEKIATPNQISPLATPESSLIINQKFTDPTSHFEEYAALLTPFQNRTEVKKLQATIKDLALEISKAEQRELYAIEKKNISADKKERLIDTQTFIHGYAATKTIKNEIAKLATKLEQKNDPELAKLSETLRDLETLMRATAHQFKGMAIAQSLENHVIYEKKNNYAILENTGLPDNEVKSSTSLDFKIGVSSKIVSNTPLAKAGVNFGVSEKSTKTTTRDGFNSFSQKHKRQVELKLSGNVNFATAAGKIEVGASRTLSNDNYKADSLDKIIKHNAVTSNDGRLNISNPKFQPYYQALATLRNIYAPLMNGKPVNPDFPHYLTFNALTYINSSHVTIKTILDKYGIRPEIEPELNINQIDSLTKGNVAPSKGKLTAVKSNPDTKTTLSVQAEVGVTNSAPLLFKDHPRQLLAANMMPKMGGMASLAYAIEFADSQALTLKPSHEFLSTTYTHDIGESLKQANDALSHWKNKQLDKALPPHLQDTQVLFEKSAMSIAPNMLTQHIDAACHALDQLKANFTEFKAAAQQFMDLTHHSVNFESPAYKQKYNQLLSTIQTHQFDVDKLSMIPLCSATITFTADDN